MKSRYKFLYKNNGPWILEESKEITQADWNNFVKSMRIMIECLKDFRKDVGFKVVDKTEVCIFDK